MRVLLPIQARSGVWHPTPVWVSGALVSTPIQVPTVDFIDPQTSVEIDVRLTSDPGALGPWVALGPFTFQGGATGPILSPTIPITSPSGCWIDVTVTIQGTVVLGLYLLADS